jgi:hypothetical protein
MLDITATSDEKVMHGLLVLTYASRLFLRKSSPYDVFTLTQISTRHIHTVTAH